MIYRYFSLKVLVLAVIFIFYSQDTFAQQSDDNSIVEELSEIAVKKGGVQYNLYFGAGYLPNQVKSVYVPGQYEPTRAFRKGWEYTLDFSVGKRINKYVFVGGELSLIDVTDFPKKYSNHDLFVTVAPNVKAYLPFKNENVLMFANASFGVHTCWGVEWGYYTNLGIGVDIKRFSAMVGCRGMLSAIFNVENMTPKFGEMYYLQLGVRLGK